VRLEVRLEGKERARRAPQGYNFAAAAGGLILIIVSNSRSRKRITD
jgi:hypothetical protein